MVRIKITVVKRLSMDEIHADTDMGCTYDGEPVCSLFEEGQVFYADYSNIPAGFCPSAYNDLYRYIHGLMGGANYPWIKEEGKIIACCADGFRPVVFRLERVDD